VKHFDRIVIGLGGVGSATLCALARRGVRALGLEQFSIAHDRGSSHGQTRIIRQAYFEHPAYVPLLRRADQLWCELEQQSGQRLFDRVGLIEIGPPDGVVLPGVARSVAEHGLSVESLTATELSERFPGFRVPEGMQAVFEPTAGLLYVERCVAAHVQAAQSAGAVVVTDETVQRIDARPQRLTVHTNKNTYTAGGVAFCAGAWSPALLHAELPLRVVRKHLHWFATSDPRMHVDQGCPVFFYEMPDGYFYGFPAVDALGVKLAEHTGGQPVTDPGDVDRQPEARDDTRIGEFLRRHLPSVGPTRLQHAVCMYTLTPDEHFVVDRHPHWDHVVLAAGLSGHGFKFTPVLGEILADLSLDQKTRWDIAFLRHDRFTQKTPESSE
jgi:sarcosine oxidase